MDWTVFSFTGRHGSYKIDPDPLIPDQGTVQGAVEALGLRVSGDKAHQGIGVVRFLQELPQPGHQSLGDPFVTAAFQHADPVQIGFYAAVKVAAYQGGIDPAHDPSVQIGQQGQGIAEPPVPEALLHIPDVGLIDGPVPEILLF